MVKMSPTLHTHAPKTDFWGAETELATDCITDRPGCWDWADRKGDLWVTSYWERDLTGTNKLSRAQRDSRSVAHHENKRQCNTTSLPSVSVTGPGMFHNAKYGHSLSHHIMFHNAKYGHSLSSYHIMFHNAKYTHSLSYHIFTTIIKQIMLQ